MKIKPTITGILDKYFYNKKKNKFILSDEKLSNQNELYIYNISKKNVSENIYYLEYSLLNTTNINENILHIVKNLEDNDNKYSIKYDNICENTLEIVKKQLYNIIINKHLNHYLLVLIENENPLDKSIIYNMYKVNHFPIT